MRDRLFLPVGGTGGGSVATPFDVPLWKEVLRYARTSENLPRVGLLATPSRLTGQIDPQELLLNHKSLEDGLGCSFILLDDASFGQGKEDVDILCITCGNTQAARDEWRRTGCEEKIRHSYERGIPVTGYSAGFILFYEWASTDSVPGPEGATYGVMPCMGILQGGAVPHADTQPARLSDFQKVLTEKEISPVLALGEEVLAVYRNERVERVLSSKPNPVAGWLEKDKFTPIPTIFL